MTQTLKIVPQGLIESGSCTFDADVNTGIITFQGDIEAGIGWFTKDYPGNGTLKLAPADLLSTGIILGKEFVFTGVVIQIASMGKGSAIANVTISSADANLKGVAELDLTKEYWSINHILVSGVADGENVTVELSSGN